VAAVEVEHQQHFRSRNISCTFHLSLISQCVTMSALHTAGQAGPNQALDEEKQSQSFPSARAVDGDRYTEGFGDLQVLRIGDGENVKLAKDGKTVLIPQPSDDPNGEWSGIKWSRNWS